MGSFYDPIKRAALVDFLEIFFTKHSEFIKLNEGFEDREKHQKYLDVLREEYETGVPEVLQYKLVGPKLETISALPYRLKGSQDLETINESLLMPRGKDRRL